MSPVFKLTMFAVGCFLGALLVCCAAHAADPPAKNYHVFGAILMLTDDGFEVLTHGEFSSMKLCEDSAEKVIAEAEEDNPDAKLVIACQDIDKLPAHTRGGAVPSQHKSGTSI